MAEFYSNFYTFQAVCFLFLIPIVIDHDLRGGKYSKLYDSFVAFFIACGSVYLFGSRGFDVGTDTPNYVTAYYNNLYANNVQEALGQAFLNRDPFFNLFTYYCALFFDLRGYFYVLAFIYVFLLVKAAYRITDRYRALFLFSFLCVAYYVSMGTNVIRTGLSMSCAILALTYFLSGKKMKGILFCVFASLFHLAAIVIVVAGLISKYIKVPQRIYGVILFICIIMSYFGLGIKDLPFIGSYIVNSERAARYASGDMEQAPSGLHFYTFTFQMFSVILFYYFKNKIKDKKYDFLFDFFLILSCFYFLCLNMNYSDRFGVLSWFFIPILLFYPVRYYKLTLRYQYSLLLCVLLVYELFAIYRLIE